MTPYDFIISLMAFNPRYEKAEIDRRTFIEAIVSKCPQRMLEEAKIKPRNGHSKVLERTLCDLVINGVLKHWVPQDYFTWNFPITPKEYYERYIDHQCTEEKKRELKDFAANF